MTRAIPRVREWRVTLADGRVFSVLAPTRRLAILNLRADARHWGASPLAPHLGGLGR